MIYFYHCHGGEHTNGLFQIGISMYYILTIYIVHLLCTYLYVQLDMQIMMHSYTPQYDSHVRDKLPLICQALLCIAQVQYSEKPYNRATHQLIISQNFAHLSCKVENILNGRLDLIPSPSPLVKIQVMGGIVSLQCKGKTLLGIVNKLLKTKSLLTSPSNVLPHHLK